MSACRQSSPFYTIDVIHSFLIFVRDPKPKLGMRLRHRYITILHIGTVLYFWVGSAAVLKLPPVQEINNLIH